MKLLLFYLLGCLISFAQLWSLWSAVPKETRIHPVIACGIIVIGTIFSWVTILMSAIVWFTSDSK